MVFKTSSILTKLRSSWKVKVARPYFVDNGPISDDPSAFGYKTGWFAFKTEDQDALFSQLRLTEVKRSTWRDGLLVTSANPAKGTPVFVCPPFSGWSLVVVGFNLDSDSDSFRTMLCEMSDRFVEAQYFLSYRVSDVYVWQKASHGVLERAFSIAGGTVTQNHGATTSEELALGFPDISRLSPNDLNELEENNMFDRWLYGTEEDPLLVASIWSVNPSEIGTSVQAPSVTGYLAQLRL